MKKIAIASDHAGFKLKESVKSHLNKNGYIVNDFGTYSEESCDYPDFAHLAAQSVISKESDLGVAICGTGNGMTMTLNKYPEIRAGLCWATEIAALIRQHNDANFLVLPARFISEELALEITDVYLSTEFEGGRHLRRINKISNNINSEREVL